VINALYVDPSLTAVTLVDPQEPDLLFTVPFRCEDQGNRLEAIFLRDHNLNERDFSKLIDIVPVPPSGLPFEEQIGRAVSYRWTFVGDRPSGCHSVTMVLTYEDNTTAVFTIQDDSLVAIETWWFYFQDGEDGAATGCPTVGPTNPR
jgi:hypothetical protein